MSHLRIKRTAEGNRFYRAAVEQLPGYAEAWAVAGQAERRLAALAVAPPAPEPPLDTGLVTDEWIEAMLGAETAAVDTDRRRRVLLRLRDRARAAVEQAVRIWGDRILAGLDNDLALLLGRGRELGAQLHGAATAADAIATGIDAAAAWAEMAPLAGDYRAVRAAQDAVMADYVDMAHAARSTNNADRLASDLLLANLDDLAPDWRRPRVNMFDGDSLWLAPWPADPVEYFAWLCTSQAQAWVPTLAQLEQLWLVRKPAEVDTRPSPVSSRTPHNGFVRVINTRTPSTPGVSA